MSVTSTEIASLEKRMARVGMLADKLPVCAVFRSASAKDTSDLGAAFGEHVLRPRLKSREQETAIVAVNHRPDHRAADRFIRFGKTIFTQAACGKMNSGMPLLGFRKAFPESGFNRVSKLAYQAWATQNKDRNTDILLQRFDMGGLAEAVNGSGDCAESSLLDTIVPNRLISEGVDIAENTTPGFEQDPYASVLFGLDNQALRILKAKGVLELFEAKGREIRSEFLQSFAIQEKVEFLTKAGELYDKHHAANTAIDQAGTALQELKDGFNANTRIIEIRVAFDTPEFDGFIASRPARRMAIQPA